MSDEEPKEPQVKLPVLRAERRGEVGRWRGRAVTVWEGARERPVRIVLVAILVVALLLGALLWWLQERYYYVALAPEPVLLVARETGEGEAVDVAGFRGVDAESSPIRYRACFEVLVPPEALAARYLPYDDPEPRNGPRMLGCYDAAEVGRALEAGEARAYLSVRDVTWGVDRVVAVMPDGRGFAWHEPNPCGDAGFDGDPLPEGCPPRPSEG